MKEITGNKRVTDGPLPNLVTESNREIFDKKETAETFNRCFVNIGPNLAVSIPENNTSSKTIFTSLRPQYHQSYGLRTRKCICEPQNKQIFRV